MNYGHRTKSRHKKCEIFSLFVICCVIWLDLTFGLTDISTTAML